jgi:P2-related tail formation protein
MTIVGYPGLTEEGRRGVIDPVRGVTTEIRYKGPVDAVNAALATLGGSTAYIEFDTTNPPIGTLLVRTPDWGNGDTQGIIQTTWELQANLITKSGYEHPTSIALGTDTLNEIISKVGDETASADDFTGNARTLFDMMAAGQDSFFQSQFVFRYSRYINRNASVSIAFDDIHRVYTSAAMITETSAPSLYQTAINEARAAMLAYYGSIPSGHTLGWLKQAPTITSVAGNKSVVTVEWYLDAWRNYYYS